MAHRSIPHRQHEIPAGQLTHNALKGLQGYRNRLVHAKSERMQFGDDLKMQIAKLARHTDDIANGYVVAMEAIVATSIEMDVHASMTINPLPRFTPSKGGRMRLIGREPSKALAPIIAKCQKSLVVRDGQSRVGD